MKKLLLDRIIRTCTIIIVLLSISCENNNPEPVDWRPIVIGKGDLKSIIGFEGSWIITKSNQSEWNNLWVNTLNSQNVGVSETVIDFEKYQILIVVEGLKGSTGYEVDIAAIEESETNIMISIEHKSPPLSGTKEVTQPYCIAKIPKSSKPIILKHKSFPPNIYPSLIGRGILKGSEGIPKQDIVIQNQTDWINLLTQMNLGSDTDLIEYYPKIDFEKFMVIGTFEKYECFYPSCPNRYIDITDIVENENDIVVIVQNLFVILTEGYPQPFQFGAGA